MYQVFWKNQMDVTVLVLTVCCYMSSLLRNQRRILSLTYTLTMLHTHPHTSTATSTQPQQHQPLKFLIVENYIPSFRVKMPKMTKGDLIQELMKLGETPPTSWGAVELAARLEELQEEKGIQKVRGKVQTPLRVWTIRLNEASKKKANLQQFMVEQLGLSLSYNETIPQLQRAALQKIYMETEPRGEDPVGFGAHAAKSYQELMMTNPEYITWAVKTWKEGDCDYRLARLARWAEEDHKKPKSSHQGYPKKEDETGVKVASLGKKGVSKALSVVSETSATSSQIQQTNEMISKLTEVVMSMKNDVDNLKEERPHKKEKSETDSEFSMISKQG